MSSTQYSCKNGRTVTIEIDDFSYTAKVHDGATEVGALEFYPIENECGPMTETVLKLHWAYLDKAGPKYLRQGIGTKCVELMMEETGYSIFAEQDDGIRKDDGSHLTGDAPSFVANLQERGLIG